MTSDPRRQLPSVDKLVTDKLRETFGNTLTTAVARILLAEVRAHTTEQGEAPSLERLRADLRQRLDRRVLGAINATGVVVHTNLGRAPWSEAAVAAAVQAAGYAMVELDHATGRRGLRGAGAIDRVVACTGAEAGLIVNNCAAAVMLALSGLARGKKVLVSRGELVEIGGGFRVPDVIEESGAELREVGTTNRTHLRDYQAALGPEVAAILRVHHSNFRQVGFVTRPSLQELVGLGLPVVVDQGSGALQPIDDEPTVTEKVAAGASLVCFSGDKLLGGPQAGIIVGEQRYVSVLGRHPLMRALRADKVTLAALEATLDDWLLDRPAPVRSMIGASVDELRQAVEQWRKRLPESVECEVVEVDGAVGGGSLPGRTWPSVALAISRPNPGRLAQALLRGSPPVLARVHRQRLYLDARTVVPMGHGEQCVEALVQALQCVG